MPVVLTKSSGASPGSRRGLLPSRCPSGTKIAKSDRLSRAIEDHARKEECGFQRIPDDVAQVAASAQRAILNNVVGAARMDEHHHSEVLDLVPERIVLRRRRDFASSMARDSDALQS